MPAYAPPAPAPRPAEPAPSDSSARVADAHAERIVILPSAYTHPEGTFYLSSNEIVLLQAGYALSDSTQVTLTATPPLGEAETVMLFDLSLKNAFLREGPLRLAAIGSVSGILGAELGNFVLGRVGAVAQLCFEPSCESSAAVSSHLLLAGPGTMMITGAGGVWRVAPWGALLAEVDSAVPLGGEVGEYSGVAIFGGFRFPYRTWALDLVVGRALDTEEPPEPAVIPWIAFTYRFLP